MSTAYTVFDSADRNTGVDLASAPRSTPSASGDTFPAGGDVYLRVKTAGSNTISPSITWPTALDAYGVSKKDFALNGGTPIPISSDRLFGPFPAVEFADPSDGQVHVNHGGTLTGSLVDVYRLTNG
jgi:hypothetical protein